MTITRSMTGFALLGAAISVPAFAQDAPPAVNNGNLAFSAGADIVSVYMFRGIEQEDSGLIFQPWANVGFGLEDNDAIGFTLGTWNSIHSDHTGASNINTSAWYETDLIAGVSYDIDKISLSATFTGYYSPNGAFADIEEIAFGVSYDDSDELGDWAVNPYALLAVETRDAGGSEDIYLELGGALGAPFIQSEDLPVELSFPFALGLSVDDYYTDASGDNEVFGFLKVGARASLPLDFIPEGYGSWTATAGVDLYFVNDDAGLLDSGDDFQLVGLVGVAMEY